MISWDQTLCHANCRQVNCSDDFAGFHLIDQHSVWRSNWKAQPASYFCKSKSHKFDEKIMTTFTNTTEQPTTWQTFQSCRAVAHFSRNFGEPPPQWEKILTLTFSLKHWHTSDNMELLSNLYFVLEHSQIAKTIIGTRCISSNSAVVIIGRLPDRISESSKLTQNPWNDCRHKDDFSLIGISHRIHAKPNLQIRCRHDLESHFSQCMIDVIYIQTTVSTAI